MSGCCQPDALLGTYVRSRRCAAHDFGDLTSGTIFYEDVAESDAANNRATLNKDMLDAIIARSVLNGIIGEDADGNTQYFSYYKQSEHDNNGNYTGAYTGRVLDKDGNALVLCKYGFYVKDTVGSNDSSYKDFDKEYCRTNAAEPALKSDEEIATMVEYFQKKSRSTPTWVTAAKKLSRLSPATASTICTTV